jgi:hypothetical protein
MWRAVANVENPEVKPESHSAGAGMTGRMGEGDVRGHWVNPFFSAVNRSYPAAL